MCSLDGNDDDDGDNDDNSKDSADDGDDGDNDNDNDNDDNDDNDDDDDDDSDSTNSTLYSCSKYGSFDSDNSTSFSSNDTLFYLTYGDGSVVYGTFGQDTIVMNNVSIDNVNFAVANFTNTTSGILGIGYEATESTYFGENISDPYEYLNFPEKLAQDGIINKPAYSLYLDENDDAEILFGAVDHDQYTGTLYKFPIVTMNSSDSSEPISRIAITLNSISINNGKLEAIVGSGYIPAVLDSGTTIAALPVGIAMTIANLLGLSFSEDILQFYGECDITEGVYFKYNFQGVEFTSPVNSYFANIVDEDDDSEGCLYQVYMTEEDYIILGDSFLRDIYTVIDLEDDVAALAYKTNSSSNDIEVISDSIPSAKNPPSSKTFGTDYHKFYYNDETLVTTKFKKTQTVSLDTAYETITISDVDSDDSNDSDYYTDDYTDYYTDDDDYTTDLSIDYTPDSTFGLTDIVKQNKAVNVSSSGSSVAPTSSSISQTENRADIVSTGASFTFAALLLSLLL